MAENTLQAPVDISDPDAVENKVFVASQYTLMWWRFRKHKLALISAIIIFTIYMIALFAEFLAPYDANFYSSRHQYAPPQRIYLIDDEGRLNLHVRNLTSELNPESLRREYVQDPEDIVPLRFLVKSEPYKLFGLLNWDVKFIGPEDPEARVYLLGADRLGRDMLSRLIYGTRLSMSIGLVGVFISLILGIILGGISGYFGGTVDNLIQRLIEFVMSMPSIPLWLGLSAAMPPQWSIIQVYFVITIILSLRGWTGLARVVRGRFLSLREEEFVMAAKLDGSKRMRIILLHMLPSFYSHIIASLTLAIPTMILAETALSFLGLGLRPPAVSWGVLLQEAQNVRSVITAPWLLAPALAVITAVMAFNFLGDGMRDAADPYAR